MSKKQKSYEFDTSGVKEMQRFSTFTDLFKAVTGREPPSGGRNLTIATNNLKRHLSYDKAINLDSNEKSKRAVVITKIYNPPLKAEENRGKHGTYIDDMSRLILVQSEFNGKNYVLWNTLGLFSRYFEELKRSPDIQKHLKDKTNELDYNLWQSNSKMQPSEREYRMLVSNQLKQITERALDSLQKGGIIEWEKYYTWIPNILTTTEDCEPRLKAFKELQDESEKFLDNLQKAALRENSVLNPDIVGSLLIGAKAKDRFQYKDLKNRLASDNSVEPIPATSEQAAAIENYQLYIRQCAYAEHHDLKKLPKEKHIPSKGKVFAVPELKKIYQSLDKSYRKRLLGEITFWQEIRFHVIDKQQLECESEFDKQLADNVTVKILKYMDNQMANHQCGITTESRINGWGKMIKGTALGDYIFANKLHKELEKLYEIREKTAQPNKRAKVSVQTVQMQWAISGHTG